jgi:hypothetical protein
MPTRRDAIVAAVAACNRSHKALPNSAVSLLQAMFASGDVCQQSIEALEDATGGLSRKSIQTALRALLAAGLIAQEAMAHGRHPSRYRLLVTLGDSA